MEELEKRVMKLEEQLHGDMGLIQVIKKLDHTVDALAKAVLVIETKDSVRMGVLGTISGLVGAIVSYIITHFFR